MKAHGYDFTRNFLAANNAEPPVFVQVNTLKISADDLAVRLKAKGVEFSPGGVSGSLSVSGAGRISALPEFREGLFYVQDNAARRAVIESGAAPADECSRCLCSPRRKEFCRCYPDE
jgi:16S rRNA (cytosine967-C5)-methyltransferase